MPNIAEIKIFARRAAWSENVELLYKHLDYEQHKCYIGVIHLKEIPPEIEAAPSLVLTHQLAQRLMDQLWDCGLRPSEGSGSAGAMAATQQHLADMRAIAFDHLKIVNPKS